MRKLLLVFILLFGITSYGQSSDLKAEAFKSYDSYAIYDSDGEFGKTNIHNIKIIIKLESHRWLIHYTINDKIVDRRFDLLERIEYETYIKYTTRNRAVFYVYKNVDLVIIDYKAKETIIRLYNSKQVEATSNIGIPNDTEKPIDTKYYYRRSSY